MSQYCEVCHVDTEKSVIVLTISVPLNSPITMPESHYRPRNTPHLEGNVWGGVEFRYAKKNR